MNGDSEMEWNHDTLSHKVIECIINVHRTLGPGFLESIYRNALGLELRQQGLQIEIEKDVAIDYQGVSVGRHRIDLLVEGRLIVELKAVEDLTRTHYAQVRSYLRATNLRVALPVNFSKPVADYRRIEPM